MATRSRTTFQKRQNEIARMEKQRDKAAKRMQRKLAGKLSPGSDGELADDVTNPDEDVINPDEQRSSLVD